MFVKKVLCVLVGLSLVGLVEANPYVGLQLGVPSINGAKSTVDTGIKRIALGYEIQRTTRFSLIAEIGAMDGVTYDAGQLGNYADDHVQVHVGSSLDGMIGVGWRLGRLQLAILGGMQSTKLATSAMASQDTLSKIQPLGSIRMQYYINPNVKLGVYVNHTFGKSGDVYTFNTIDNSITLNHIPSITTFMVGVQLAL